MLDQQLLDFGRQLEEANRVRDCRPLFSGLTRDFFMRQAEFAIEPVVGRGKLDGIQIFALDVLNQRDSEELFLCNVLPHNGNLFQPRELRSPPAALAGNELKLVPCLTDNERLDYSIGPYGRSQLL